MSFFGNQATTKIDLRGDKSFGGVAAEQSPPMDLLGIAFLRSQVISSRLYVLLCATAWYIVTPQLNLLTLSARRVLAWRDKLNTSISMAIAERVIVVGSFLWYGRWKPIVDRFRCSAVGMAADSADTSLLTSAIEEDPTESPNANRSGPEILHLHCYHHHHHPRGKDVPRKRRRNQNGALLRDFDGVIDYVDYTGLIRSWLSRTCSKSNSCVFSFKQTSYVFP